MATAFTRKTQLRIGFFLLAIVCQILAPKLPAFDTSHLVSTEKSLHIQNDILDHLNFGSKVPNVSKLNLPKITEADDLTDTIRSTPQLVDAPSLRWDALHYEAVALHGSYVYEHQYAFSPGVPVVLRLVHLGKHYLLRLFIRLRSTSGLLSLPWLEVYSWVVSAAKLALITCLASEPCFELYRLTELVTGSSAFAHLTTMVYLIMGAPPVVLRSAYAEPFFAYFSFRGMRACHRHNYLVASLNFSLAVCFRANGTLLVGFILYDLIARPALLDIFSDLPRKSDFRISYFLKVSLRAAWKTRSLAIVKALVLSLIVISPFLGHQYMAYSSFCRDVDGFNSPMVYPRPWCSARLPMIYAFVQSHYWDVGLWRYWTLAQIPNFFLAAPMLLLVGVSSLSFLWIFWRGFSIQSTSPARTPKFKLFSDVGSKTAFSFSPSLAFTLLPYALHSLALSIVLFTAAHVQIALRVLPAATPWAAWAGAALVMKGARENPGGQIVGLARNDDPNRLPGPVSARTWWPFISHLWIGWSVIWAIVSSILWLAFLPPA